MCIDSSGKIMMMIILSLFLVIGNFSLSISQLYHTFQVNNSISIINSDPVNNNWIARGYFNETINSTGLGYLEIETNPFFSDEEQSYHAGFLEGKLTSNLIYSHWFNMVNSFCRNTSLNNCSQIEHFMDENSQWIRGKIVEYKDSDYWYQINLFYTQLRGILDGYNMNTNFKRLNWTDILWLNLVYEVHDIQSIVKYNSDSPKTALEGDTDHCSVLIKLMPDNEDVYFGHNTWIDYQIMLRIIKKYILPFKTSNNGATIPGAEMSMSSYPATVLSIDDFYLISSGLAVTETTITVLNKSLFENVRPEGIVWEGVRSMIANRLASDGETWHDIFAQWNSGTCNNQWMVFDYKKFKPGKKLPGGSLWISEQMPGIVIKKDVTNVLNGRGYWSSYNVPYDEQIYEVSGYAKRRMEPDGVWFSYSETPRAMLFKRDHQKVRDMDSFMELMRSNDYLNDPLAKCSCIPVYSGKGAIASREDLNPIEGRGMNECKPRGAIDAKITNSQLFLKLQFVVVSGPSTGTNATLPAFRWSTSRFSHLAHMSHPDEFDFQPILYDWILEKNNPLP